MIGTSERSQANPWVEHLMELAEMGRKMVCPQDKTRISVGLATCGRATGALTIRDILAGRDDWDEVGTVVSVGCIGACFAEPLVDVRMPDGRHYFYGKVDRKSVWHIIRAAHGSPPSSYVWAVAEERQTGVLNSFHDLRIIKAPNGALPDFFGPQTRRVSGRCGLIDPESLEEYAATGGYGAVVKALFQMKPQDVIGLVTASGLRGRGGAGFLTGLKWEAAASAADPVRFVVANADEGDPGAYMDRALLESDPHSVLEGIILASYAVGAHQAYVFVRHEYPLAVRSLRQAIASARQAGLLGENILGSGYDIDVAVIESAGAFVCGEETSMLKVIQGRRGEPQRRPPYPSQQGLWGHPTVVNNVETLASIPEILLYGPEDFRTLGTPASPGTKIFCLTGDVRRTGFIEVPLGTSAREVVEKIGGVSARAVKALQIGGPSGGIVPYSDFALDYETVVSSGAMIGSGGLVVLGQGRCMVDLARHLVSFMADESCGKCVMCREGLQELEDMLEAVTTGHADTSTLEEIQDLARAIGEMAFCGLGKTAANPVLTTLKYFLSEYQAHVEGRCPALSCKPLIQFEVIQAQCKDCRCCYLVCPSEAVMSRSGKEHFTVDNERCTKCAACEETCPWGCIRKITGVGTSIGAGKILASAD